MYPSTEQYEVAAQNDLMHALSALHMGGKYADLTIVCNYRQWACHKAIVCSRSGFFDGACSHNTREAQTGIIDLSEDDEDAVEQMIHFFYHLDYLNEQPNQQPSAMFRHRAYSNSRRTQPKKLDLTQIQDPLLAQMGFYGNTNTANTSSSKTSSRPSSRKGPRSSASDDSFNDRYCAMPPTLNRFTPPPEVDSADFDAEFDDDLVEEDDNSTEEESHLILHTQVYALAEKYDIPTLKQLARRKFEIAMACYYDAPEFAAAVEAVYCSTIDTDRGLRDIVLQAFRHHPQLVNTQDVYAVISETPSLALELFKMERGIPI